MASMLELRWEALFLGSIWWSQRWNLLELPGMSCCSIAVDITSNGLLYYASAGTELSLALPVAIEF